MNTLDYFRTDSTDPIVEIPNVTRLELLRLCRELDFRVGVEIGVEKGLFAQLLCHTNPQMKLYGVDPYSRYTDYHDYFEIGRIEAIADIAKDIMYPFLHRHQFKFIKKFSVEAAKDFEDESVDFVYIDANHELDYPYQDMKAWWPKLKKGGIMAGHDYIRLSNPDYTVVKCVHRFAKEHGLQIFLLGTTAKKPKELRDWSRSWMFLK